MLYKPSAKVAIESPKAKIVLGIEHIKEPAIGDIDGTNKKFTVKNGPIFPRNKRSIPPQPNDVTVYLLKGTTYTETTVTSINTITDTDLDMEYFGEIELPTAPAASAADAVVVTYHEELTPYKIQSVKDDSKRDSKDVTEIGSDIKQTSYGAKSKTLTIESIVADIEPQRKIGFEEYTGSGTVQEGYIAYDEREGMVNLLAYVNVEGTGDVFIGRYYYEGRGDIKELFGLKTGDNPTTSIEIAVDEKVRLIVAENT